MRSATSSNGSSGPRCLRSSRMMWKPVARRRPAASRSCPASSANSACSNSGVVCPAVIWPRLPPCAADGQAECAARQFGKPLGRSRSSRKHGFGRRARLRVAVPRRPGARRTGYARPRRGRRERKRAPIAARSSAGRRPRPARGVATSRSTRRADQRLFVGLAPALVVAHAAPARCRAARASCSSSSRTTSARAAACQAAIGFARRMVLHLAGDRVARDDHAVDADRLRLAAATVAWTEQAHGLTPPAGRCGRGAATAVPRARAHDLIAAAAEIPDRRAPDVHQPREREDQEDASCRGTDAP